MNHKQIAALAGVAPFNRDSGKLRGKTRGVGRSGASADGPVHGDAGGASYNPAIKAFYQRLLEAGKPKKVALTACMRKLLIICNAVIRRGKPWDPARATATP